MTWRTVEPETTAVSCPAVKSRSSDGIQTTAIWSPDLSWPRPVFDSQSWHFAKIAQVSGQQRGIAGQHDCRDLQVHGPDPNPILDQSLILRGGLVVKVENLPDLKVLKELVQALVRIDLPWHVAGAGEEG